MKNGTKAVSTEERPEDPDHGCNQDSTHCMVLTWTSGQEGTSFTRESTPRFLDTPKGRGYNLYALPGGRNEKDVSTEYQKKEEEPRLQKAHEYPGRKGDNQEAQA